MFEFFCERCNLAYPIESKTDRCQICGGPFSLKKEYSELNVKLSLMKESTSFWSLSEVLPPTSLMGKVSLGEPITPIITRDVEYGSEKVKVLIKNEGVMPTGSFKDRGSAILVSHLKHLQIREVATDSSGNAGVSMAAYSSQAGISINVFAPSSIAPEKRRILELYSANLFICKTRKEASELARVSGHFYANHAWNPIFIEGTKTFIYETLKQKAAFDAIYIPLGSGTLFLGIVEAIREIKEHMPSLEEAEIFAIRPAGYGLSDKELGRASEETIAEGIAVEPIYRLDQIRSAMKRYRVKMIYINNDDIVLALRFLIKQGLIVEPTGASAMAGLLKHIKSEGRAEVRRPLIPVTGSGFKSLDKLAKTLLTSQSLV